MRPVTTLRSTLTNWRSRLRPNSSSATTNNAPLVDTEFLRKLDRLSLSVGQDLVRGLMGEHLAQRRTTGIEFADYRQYSPGDDIRRVDWNAYARLGTLHIRQAQAEHDTVLYLLVDASPSMGFGQPSKFFAARRMAAALGYIALSHLDKVILAAPGAGIRDEGLGVGEQTSAIPNPQPPTPIKGRAEAANLFRYLQDLQVGQAAQFDDLLGGWSTRRGQGKIAVLLSDLLLDEYKEGVRQLVAAGFQVLLLHILSPEELRPPKAGDMDLIDSETGQHLEIYLGDESLNEYHRRLNSWLTETQEWCRSQGASYLLVESTWDVERLLLETLRRRGVVA